MVLSSTHGFPFHAPRREAYVLSCVDGNSCVEDIVDVVGKPDHETLRALAELLSRQAIRV